MKRLLYAATLWLSMIVALTGCGSAGSPSPAPAIALMNQPSFAPGTVCNQAMRRGPLTRDAVSGLGVGGMHVRWPWKWTAVLIDGRAVLYDDLGRVVAKEGDAMQIGGSGPNDTWSMCGDYHVGLPYPTDAH